MVVALLKVTLHIPHANSLKAKRAVVKSTIEKLRAKHNISIAETGMNDLWQKAEIGIAYIGVNGTSSQALSDRIQAYFEQHPEVSVIDLVKDEIRI